MKLRMQAAEAAKEVKTTAQQIGNSVQWNTAALMAVTAVSMLALVVAIAALGKVSK